MNNLRFALRQLRKSPGFTAIAVLALALGIGANAAIFSIVHGVLLRPLPFPDQERLVFMGEWSERVPGMSISYPNLLDFQTRQTSFDSFGGARGQGFNYVGASESERLAGSMATYDLFNALGASAMRGRLFTAVDDAAGAEPTAVIRASLWRRYFNGSDDVLGRQIVLSGRPFTIIGVLPDSFRYPSPTTEVWVPLGVFADWFTGRGNHPGIYAVGKLKDGVTFEAAKTEMVGIAAQLAAQYPDSNARQSVSMQMFTDRVFQRIRMPLFVLMAAAGCVLLIACANVANLQLARAQARDREFAVRTALGAGRAQIVRQVLIESVLLGALGCAAGLALGWAALAGLKTVLPANVPRIEEVTLNPWVLLFAVAASVITSVAFGLVPAWHAVRQDVRTALAQGGRASTHAGGRVRTALVVAEFALTCLLLVGAGLMLRTLGKLHDADPGYDTARVVAFSWTLPSQTYPEDAQRLAVIDRALERVRAIPGVSSAGLVNPLPLSGSGNQRTYYVEGAQQPEPGTQPSTEVFNVSGDLFATFGIPLLSGRGFGVEDHAGTRRVAIVDTRFVELNFPAGTDPVGRRFAYGSGPPDDESGWIEIIGVAAHIENYGLGRDTREQSYILHSQEAPGNMTFLVRTDGSPDAIMSSIRPAMREVAPEVPIFSLRTMDDMFGESISAQRLTVVLLGSFAGLALLLAAVGLYGVLSYTVGQRTREIGVRMALGATSAGVMRLMVRHGLIRAGVGLLLGVLAALGLTRVLGSVLYEVSPLDPLSFGMVVVVLAGIGVIACLIPARRAARVDPLEALRAE